MQLEDIFPTVLDMAGLPLAKPRTMGPYLKQDRKILGRTLLGRCRGETPAEWRDAAYWRATTTSHAARSVRAGCSLMRGLAILPGRLALLAVHSRYIRGA